MEKEVELKTVGGFGTLPFVSLVKGRYMVVGVTEMLEKLEEDELKNHYFGWKFCGKKLNLIF